MTIVERASLCIVGAGYAGLNALNAASKYLPRHSRVVVIDRGSSWGGMWRTSSAYSFVRLHQSYDEFTAGEREWSIRSAKPPSRHLATRAEVIAHFEDVVSSIVDETCIELYVLWGHEAVGRGAYAVVDEVGGDGMGVDCGNSRRSQQGASVRRLRLVARPIFGLVSGSDSLTFPDVVVFADRLIKAEGFDVRPKPPLVFPGVNDLPSAERKHSQSIHSLTPADMATPKWTSRIRNSGAPIVVVGSGKTAMDTLLAVAGLLPDVECERRRVWCVAGRGTWFFDRAVLASSRGPRLVFAVLDMFDGTNASEVYKAFARRGLFHSAVPDPSSFMSGTCSAEELGEVRRVLGVPAGAGVLGESVGDCDNIFGGGLGRIFKAHLLNVAPAPSGFVLYLRFVGGGDRAVGAGANSDGGSGDGAAVVRRARVPPGTFLINCTDSTAAQSMYDPIVSPDGLVLSPQLACGFSGPSAHLLTHAWYLGRIDPLWRSLPRILRDPRRKDRMGLELQMLVVLAAGMVAAALPSDIRRSTKALRGRKRVPGGGGSALGGGGSGDNDHEEQEAEFRNRALASIPGLIAKMQWIMPLRYDDTDGGEGGDVTGCEASAGGNSKRGEHSFLGGRIGAAGESVDITTDSADSELRLEFSGRMRAKL